MAYSWCHVKSLYLLPLGLVFLIRPAAADGFAPMALNSLSTTPAKITSAKVMDVQGAVVGSVARIETDAMGKPLKVVVNVAGGRVVAIEASAIGYDDAANVLVTAMDQKQLAQMAKPAQG
jgi:hypothetical protein